MSNDIHNRLSEVPAGLLANRLTSSLILQKGDLAKYDAVLERFIRMLRKEAAEDRAEMLEALKLAEDVLARAPFSTDMWANGMHPNAGITQIRAAITKATGKSDDA